MQESVANNFDAEEREVDTESIKCSGCGANMVFDPEKQMLSCPHCGTTASFNTETFSKELSLLSGFDAASQWTKEQAVVFCCDNCGAKVVLQKDETATSCPFCGTAHVKKSEELAGVKPNALIPFTFDGDKALEYSKTWARKRFFAPRKFKKHLQTDNVKGVYTPCFTFDSYTTSYYEGRIGTTHTRTVGSGKNKRTQTYVVWRNIRGTYNRGFDDVLITAGAKLDQRTLDKISPFETNSSKEFEEKFMLGFMAYHYDKELTDCWGDAKKVMDSHIKREILSGYVYDKVAYFNVSTSHENVTYKYVMLPVYVGNYRYNKKAYNFYVNGETGKVNGKYPKSVPKILAVIFGVVAVAVGIALLLTL